MQDPENQEVRINIEEVEPDVYFICDEDGPIMDEPALDSGPYSVRADAEHTLGKFREFVAEENAQVEIDAREWWARYG